MNNPKITIITVSYNAAKSIEKTILSVLNQKYSEIQYVIIDGNSTDGTVDIIKKYENRISSWISEPDEGIYDAMNKGIDIARGQYIYFLGADDRLVDNEIIKKISGFLTSDIDVVSGQVWLVDEALRIQKVYSNKFNLEDIHNGYCIPHQGLFIKTNILKKYRFDCNYKIVADRELFYKLYFDDKISFFYIDIKVAYYSADGISSLQVEARTLEDILVMTKYGMSCEIMEKRKKYFKYKNTIKKILNCIGMLRCVRKLSGWKNME